jgi:holliday junction DNA helicase RuvA
MIARICGKITQKCANHLIIDVGGISYQVFIPATVMQRIAESVPVDASIGLVTYHYFHSEPSKSIPILIGFLSEIEKEFFETFITVSGIGPRAALKALNQPISLIAKAIDEGDVEFLRSLPGIGQQRAKEVVAKLQNKVGKFGLIRDKLPKSGESASQDIVEEVVAVMAQLEYKQSEAMLMVKKAIERCPGLETAEELLNEVYKQRKSE